MEEAILYKCTSCNVLFQCMEDAQQHICVPLQPAPPLPPQPAAQEQAQSELYKCSACNGLYNDLTLFGSHVCSGSLSHGQVATYEQSDALNGQVISFPESYGDKVNEQHIVVNDPSGVTLQLLEPEQYGNDSGNTVQYVEDSKAVVFDPANLNQQQVVMISNENGEQQMMFCQEGAGTEDSKVSGGNNTVTYLTPQDIGQEKYTQLLPGQNHVVRATKIKQEKPEAQPINAPRERKETGERDTEEGEETPVVECPGCSLLFSNRKQLRIHKRNKHHIQLLKSCYQCERFFSSQASLSHHQRLIHRKQRLQPTSKLLPPNSIGYIDELTYSAGLKKLGVQEDQELASDSFRCFECLASFSDGNDLQEHMEFIHGVSSEPKFECRKCDRSYPTKDKLLNHHRKHVQLGGRAGYLCDEPDCRKSFRTKLALEFHIRTHLGLYLDSTALKKSFRCRYCPRRFSRRAQGTKHESLHRQFPKACLWCQVAFIDRNALQRHCRKQHQKRKRCLYCQQKFIFTSQLSSHVNQRHPVDDDNDDQFSDSATIPDPVEAQQYPGEVHVRADTAFYYCTKCVDIFTSHRALMNHHRSASEKHSRTCVMCGGITFGTVREFEHHYTSKHHPRRHDLNPSSKRYERLPKIPGEGFLCAKCGSEFANQKGLRIHMGKAHNEIRKASKSTEKPPQQSNINHEPIIEVIEPDLPNISGPCVVTVTQEGNVIPISTSVKAPDTRILRVVDAEDLNNEDGTMRSGRKKQLHNYIYQLRNLIQDGLGTILPYDRPPVEIKSYASYFEDILNLPPVQSHLADMESVAGGCRVTFSLPFPHNLVSLVWVNFVMSFERMKPGQEVVTESAER